MLKELKYLLFLFVISLFFYLLLNFYFSDDNQKNSYRSYKDINKNIINYSLGLNILESDTIDIVEYIEKKINKNKKNYNFWVLINNND